MRKFASFFTIFVLGALCLTACVPSAPTDQPAANLDHEAQTLQLGAVLNAPDPDTWAKFVLKGQLIFIIYQSQGNQVVRLDLSSGKMTLIYQAPQDAQLNAAMLSPDGRQLVVVYAPPPDSLDNYLFSNLFLLPSDGSGKLTPVIQGAHPFDAYYNPVWAPDGKSLYATHFHRGDGTQANPDRHSVDHVSLNGQTTPVLSDAIWPVLSPSGNQIAYLTARLDSSTNQLSLAGVDGSNPHVLVATDVLFTEDYHFFSQDGKTIYFSAVNLPTSGLPGDSAGQSTAWWERLLGIEVVSAHNLPSDWYRVAAAGGSPERLTKFQESGLAGAFSPDGKHITLLTQSHLYVANPDGSGLQPLLNLIGFGTI